MPENKSLTRQDIELIRHLIIQLFLLPITGQAGVDALTMYSETYLTG